MGWTTQLLCARMLSFSFLSEGPLWVEAKHECAVRRPTAAPLSTAEHPDDVPRCGFVPKAEFQKRCERLVGAQLLLISLGLNGILRDEGSRNTSVLIRSGIRSADCAMPIPA
jgi:hypothetical protein